MKIENALKHFGPKGMNITGMSGGTSPDRITGTDLMAAMGMAEARASFGMAAFLGKSGISTQDKIRTVEELSKYALRHAPKLVVKSAGNRLGQCMALLAKLAFEEYARSAASMSECEECKGDGLIYSYQDVVKHPGITNADGEVVYSPTIKRERVGVLCKHCNGKGKVSQRCRCHGTGRVRDLEKSALLGRPIDKICERCSGRGYKRTPASKAYRAIAAWVPELQERTWNRNWKPYFEALVAKCDIEESYADSVFNEVTR